MRRPVCRSQLNASNKLLGRGAPAMKPITAGAVAGYWVESILRSAGPSKQPPPSQACKSLLSARLVEVMCLAAQKKRFLSETAKKSLR